MALPPPIPPDDEDAQPEGPTLPQVAPGSPDSNMPKADPGWETLNQRIAQEKAAKQIQLAGWLGGGSAAPVAPKMRNGEVVGSDGYTASERDYMKGAGVDPNAKAPAPPAAPAPAAPAASGNMMGEKGLGTRRQNQQQQLEDINQGKDLPVPKPRSMAPGGDIIAQADLRELQSHTHPIYQMHPLERLAARLGIDTNG